MFGGQLHYQLGITYHLKRFREVVGGRQRGADKSHGLGSSCAAGILKRELPHVGVLLFCFMFVSFLQARGSIH